MEPKSVTKRKCSHRAEYLVYLVDRSLMAVRRLRSALLAALIIGTPVFAFAEDRDEAPNPAILGIALEGAKVSLQSGLALSEQRGKPIAARFEMPNGDVQLAVTVAQTTGFAEIVIDPRSGAVLSAERITDPADLAEASAQSRAMDQARLSLPSAIAAALQGHPGSQAVSIVPQIRNSHPIALVTILTRKRLDTVSTWLE
jgi:hypothetical protein